MIAAEGASDMPENERAAAATAQRPAGEQAGGSFCAGCGAE
jgi:hypothetical protein